MPEIVDFSIPNWLIIFYHVIGAVSLMLDAFSIYLVLFQSSKIDNFRFFLLNFQIACSVTDILLTVLYQPVPLYPLMSGFAVGALVTVFDTMACFLWIYQIGAMMICFVKKHQTIAEMLKKFKIHTILLVLMMIFFILYITSVSVTFYSLCVPQELELEYIAENFPEYLHEFLLLPNFAIYEANVQFFIFVLLAVSGGILAFCIMSLILFNVFRMLSMLKSQISAANYRKHRAAIKSLIAQFATSSVCFAPPIFLVFAILANVPNIQVIVELLLVLACLHSSLNVTVLIITFPPYRKFVMELLRCKTKALPTNLSTSVYSSRFSVSRF